MAQAGETLYDKINLQQVDVESTSIWPPREGRYTSKRSPRQVKLCHVGAP